MKRITNTANAMPSVTRDTIAVCVGEVHFNLKELSGRVRFRHSGRSRLGLTVAQLPHLPPYFRIFLFFGL